MSIQYLYRHDLERGGLRCQSPVTWSPDGAVLAHRRCGHSTPQHVNGKCVGCMEQNMPDSQVKHEMVTP